MAPIRVPTLEVVPTHEDASPILLPVRSGKTGEGRKISGRIIEAKPREAKESKKKETQKSMRSFVTGLFGCGSGSATFCGRSLRRAVLTLLAGLGLCVTQAFAQPIISSVNPSSGSVGSSVTIAGSNFSATPANNIVYLSAVKAGVTAATTTKLTVIVSTGAPSAGISPTAS